MTAHLTSKRITILSVALGLFYSGVACAVTWPAHINQAQTYMSSLQAANNSYGSPPFLGYDSANKLKAITQCSSFTTLLLKKTYSTKLTDAALIALTGSSLPYADQWYDALLAQTADAKSGLALKKNNLVVDIQRGDILASSYTVSGNTGHVMLVDSIILDKAGISPPYPIPNVPKVNRYIAKIYDSSNTPHGNYANATNPDSRYNKEWTGSTWVADTGIGSGYIAIYEDVMSGKLVAWAWNTSMTTSSFYYAVTPPAGSTLTYRPIVAGYISGL